MPKMSFTVMVHDDDEGEDLGEYESDYLPRVGDDFAVWHPRVCKDPHVPFLGVVSQVRHEAHAGDRDEAKGTYGPGSVSTTVWITEECAAPPLYCDCTPRDREMHEVVDGRCGNCRGQRVERKK